MHHMVLCIARRGPSDLLGNPAWNPETDRICVRAVIGSLHKSTAAEDGEVSFVVGDTDGDGRLYSGPLLQLPLHFDAPGECNCQVDVNNYRKPYVKLNVRAASTLCPLLLGVHARLLAIAPPPPPDLSPLCL